MAYTRNFRDDVRFYRQLTYNKTVTYQSVNVAYLGSRSGSSVPEWRDKIKRGENASSPYSLDRNQLVEQRYGTVGMTASIIGNPGAGSQDHSYTGYLTPGPTAISHLVASSAESNSKALTAIYKKMNSQLSQLNAPASFLEMGDVIRQFGRPFKSIVDLTERHINRLYLQRRGIENLRYNKKQLVKILADTYLEYAFGLAPLINDTKKAAEALARLAWEVESPSIKTRLVGRGISETGDITTDQLVPGSTFLVVDKTTRRTTQVRTQYVAGFKAYPTADRGSHDRLMQLLGFRPESWIPGVWEAVPWSWLVDYFVNVQELLNSLEASVIKPSWIVKTVSTVTDYEVYEKINPKLTIDRSLNAGWNRCVPYGSELDYHKSRRMTMQRTIPAQLGFPELYFRLPDSWHQIANMASVITQLQKSTPAISLETNYRAFLRKK